MKLGNLIKNILDETVRECKEVTVYLTGKGIGLSMLDCRILGNNVHQGNVYDVVKQCGTEDPDIVLTFDLEAIKSLHDNENGIVIFLSLL